MIGRRTLLAAPLLAVPASAGAEPRVRAVLELFTSQGCSSCPPADRLAAELAVDPSLLIVSRPVDYWDALGWRDSLAQHAFTERQIAYARQRGDDQVYTPQMVVDGRAPAIGSDRDAIEGLIGVLPLTVSVRLIDGEWSARVDGVSPKTATTTVLVWWLLQARTVAIGRGENARARVTYSHVVLEERPLGTARDGGIFRLGAPPAGADAVAAVVQAGDSNRPGAIFGGSAATPLTNGKASAERP